MNKKLIIISVICILMVSISGIRRGDTMDNQTMIFTRGEKASNEIFSNTVWVNMLVTDKDKTFDTQVYNVTFEPAARTHWHSHPGGQILLATEGTGYYQEKGKPAQLLKKGDVVTIAPNLVHWHGAAPETQFIHIGLSAQVRLGPAKWLGPVTDQEYKQATAK